MTLVAVLLYRVAPDFYSRLAVLVTEGKLVSIATLIGVPVALIVATYRLGDSALNPQSESAKRLLVNWPNYWMLKARVLTSFAFGLISCVGVWIGWYLIVSARLGIGSLICVASYAVAVTTVASMALARLEVRDILAKDY